MDSVYNQIPRSGDRKRKAEKEIDPLNNSLHKRTKVYSGQESEMSKQAKFHITTEERSKNLDKPVTPGYSGPQSQFSYPGTKSLRMIIRVPRKCQINVKQTAASLVEKTEVVRNDTRETAGKQVNFHTATKAKPYTLEKSGTPRSSNSQSQFSNPDSRSLKMTIRVPKSCQRKLSSATFIEPEDNLLKTSVVPGCSGDRSKSTDLNSKSIKMVIRVSKNRPHESSSAFVRPKYNMLKKSVVPVCSGDPSKSTDLNSKSTKMVSREPKSRPHESLPLIVRPKYNMLDKSVVPVCSGVRSKNRLHELFSEFVRSKSKKLENTAISRNSGDRSKSTDLNSKSIEMVSGERKNRPQESFSENMEKKALLMQKALKYVKY